MALFRRDDDEEQKKPTAYNSPRGLTAAAVQINMNSATEAEMFRDRKKSQAMTWQSEAWEYYDAIGQIKYAVNLVANVVSRIRLYAAIVEDPAEAPVQITESASVQPALAEAAVRALARLDSAYGGQAGMLRDACLNLSIAGECYLVQVPERKGKGLPETWDIRSIDELQIDSEGQYYIQARREGGGGSSFGNASGKDRIYLPKGAFMGRIWRAHPRFSDEPDSSMRGLLDMCSEYLLLNRSFRALERSRINAGIIYLPDGLTTASEGDPDGSYDDTDSISATPEEIQDNFENEFADALVTPVEDESSAASVVPLIVRGPVELGKEIRHITFDRKFDATLEKRAETVLEYILQGLDVPKDVVTGLANVKYSNAVQIDEALYKAHIEPMLLLISDALTVSYLRPYLRAIGYDETEVQKAVIWYDPSSVATRNDRAQDANDGFDKGALSFDAWRRAHGFSDQDAPSPTEWAMRQMDSKGQIAPELFEALLAVFAPEVMENVRSAAQATSVAPVPDAVQQVLDGGQAPTAEPGAEAAPGLAEPGTAPEEVPPTDGVPGVDAGTQPSEAEDVPAEEAVVEPGEDAPPFPTGEEEEEDEPLA